MSERLTIGGENWTESVEFERAIKLTLEISLKIVGELSLIHISEPTRPY